MAQLDARTDDFIRMLLDVSGRARPTDILGVGADEAGSLLQAYAAAHPERSLAFSEGVLSVSASAVPSAPPAPSPTPSPVPAPEPAPVAAAMVPEPIPAPQSVPAHEQWATPAAEQAAAPAAEQWPAPSAAPPDAPPAAPAAAPAAAPPAAPAAQQWSAPASEQWAPPSPEQVAAPAPPQSTELPSWVYEQPIATPTPSESPQEAFDATGAPIPSAPFGVPTPAPMPGADIGYAVEQQPAAQPAEPYAGDLPASYPAAVPVPEVDAFGIPAPAADPAAAWAQPGAQEAGASVAAPADPAAAWAQPSGAVPGAAEWQGSADAQPGDFGGAYFPDEPPLDWYWWLVPVIFSLLGGIVAWLVLKQRQPKGARKLLILGFVVFGVNIVLGVLSFFLGLTAVAGAVGAAPIALGLVAA